MEGGDASQAVSDDTSQVFALASPIAQNNNNNSNRDKPEVRLSSRRRGVVGLLPSGRASGAYTVSSGCGSESASRVRLPPGITGAAAASALAAALSVAAGGVEGTDTGIDVAAAAAAAEAAAGAAVAVVVVVEMVLGVGAGADACVPLTEGVSVVDERAEVEVVRRALAPPFELVAGLAISSVTAVAARAATADDSVAVGELREGGC